MIEYKNFKNECGIYCFTNKVNGKCYVGQAVNLKKRLRSHYSSMKKQNVPNMIFYTAVAKYGIDNFDLEILEFLDPNMDLKQLKDLLDEKEKFYIKEKNSYAPNGYNQTLGGDAGVLGYKMTEEQREKISIASKIQNEKNKKLIWIRNLSETKYYNNYTYDDASKKSGVSKSVIKEICNKTHKYPYSKGWTFAFDEISLFNNCATAFRNMAKGNNINNEGLFLKGYCYSNIKVLEYDSNKTLIYTHNSIKNTAENIGISANTLTNKLHKSEICMINNRFFKLSTFKKVKTLTEEHKEKIRNSYQTRKPVDQYDLNNCFIQTFDSITSAANSVNSDIKSIRRCCTGKAKTCKQYIWKYHNI